MLIFKFIAFGLDELIHHLLQGGYHEVGDISYWFWPRMNGFNDCVCKSINSLRLWLQLQVGILSFLSQHLLIPLKKSATSKGDVKSEERVKEFSGELLQVRKANYFAQLVMKSFQIRKSHSMDGEEECSLLPSYPLLQKTNNAHYNVPFTGHKYTYNTRTYKIQ